MTSRAHRKTALLLPAALAACFTLPFTALAQSPRPLTSPSGLRLLVDPANADPTLRVVLPGRPETDTSMEVLVPEHVTVRRQGEEDAKRQYLWEPGPKPPRVVWRVARHSFRYTRQLPGGLGLRFTATLESDGVLLRYEFRNRSDVRYSMVYAPTDPRLTGPFHDVRLERTYVHFPDGFRLLAAETPERLTEPLAQWLPARYHASFTWPVPALLVRRDPDGITNYDTSRPVDQPMIATRSVDGQWLVVSFTRTTGNVWSNPELTCQHVDPTPPLPAHGRVVIEVKLLVLRGTLDDALARVEAGRASLH